MIAKHSLNGLHESMVHCLEVRRCASLHFQLPHAHAVASGHAHPVAAARRAGFMARSERYLGRTFQTYALPRYLDDLQKRPMRDAAVGHYFEGEAQRLRFHAGEPADLQPYRLDASEVLAARHAFDDLQ